MAEDLTSWIPLILPRVFGCPDFEIESKVLWTARDFCGETQLWDNQALTAIDLVATTPSYALASTSGDIVGIDSVEIDSVPVRPTTEAALNSRYSFWRSYTEARPHRFIFNVTSNNIRLVYTPSEALTGGLEVWVSLKPLEDATDLPDFLWEQFRDAIKHGALGELLSMSGMPWYDEIKAEVEKDRYRAMRDTAKGMKETGRTRMDVIANHDEVFFA